jgi:hypothetical protein
MRQSTSEEKTFVPYPLCVRIGVLCCAPAEFSDECGIVGCLGVCKNSYTVV